MSIRTRLADVLDRSSSILLAASKRARRVRTADEFNVARMTPTIRPPVIPSAAWSWSVPEIMSARDSQMIGQFVSAVRLAETFNSDDACFTAKQNRLAPQRCLSVELVQGKGPRSSQIAGEGEALFGKQGIAVSPATMADINRCIADHGVAIGVNAWTPRADGSRVDVEHKCWPLEFVFYHTAARCLVTRVDPNPTADAATLPGMPRDVWGDPKLPSNLMPIIHGDGRWTIYQKSDFMPWRHDAALLSTALIYAAHAYAIRDWSKSAAMHGSAKVVGALPEGFDLDEDSEHVQRFLKLLADIAASDMPYGIKPFGSDVQVLASPSNMHQVFSDLALNREKAVHRVYTGTDAALGAQGGAPGLDVESLFGVTTTIVQGDLSAIDRGFNTGVVQPWAAINFGDSTQAPSRRYVIPDDDEAARVKDLGERQTNYTNALANLRRAGVPLTQQSCDAMAEQYGAQRILVSEVAPPASNGVAPSTTTPSLTLAPTDLARVVTVNEARASAHLPPLMRNGAPDPDGFLTVEQYSTKTGAPPPIPAPPLSVVR